MPCCDRPRPTDRTICRDCQTTTRRKLTDLGGYLHAELEVTLMRADRTTTSPHARTIGRERPLPYNEHASQVAQGIHATLLSWVMLTCDEAGATLPHNTTPSLCQHLTEWLGWLVKHPAGDELVHDITHLHQAAIHTIDLPPEASRVYVGTCLQDDCPGELWAHFPRATDDRPNIRCTECATIYHPETWKALGEQMVGRKMQQDRARQLAAAILGKRAI